MSIINIIEFKAKDEFRHRYRYALYERKLTFDGTMAYSRHFIVLKNQYDVIVNFTTFHKYVVIHGNSVYCPLTSNARAKLLYVCDMLNYVFIDNYERTKASHVFQITKEMLEMFFRDYALEVLPSGVYHSRQSVEKCVSAVTGFLRKLCKEYEQYMYVNIEQLYNEVSIRNSRGKIIKNAMPNFQVRGIPENKRIFRDIPTKVFAVLLNQAFKYSPEIAFAICVQAFAGLRPSEAMNLRQESSPLRAGLVVTLINGVTKTAELDISREYVLRSDGVAVGGIKKERKQKVYPAFIAAFATAYERHKKFLSTKTFEKEYCPMFVNSRGMAMTYADYRGQFRKLIENHLRPELLKHDDPECRLYGQLLYENPLGPHSLRHWFSVMLVLMGEDVAQLQFWRGDRNPESAITYLQNKGELMRELSVANNKFAEILMQGVTDYEQ